MPIIAGCYVMHIRCDGEGCPDKREWEYTGQAAPECRRMAREAGWGLYDWRWGLMGRAYCPRCMLVGGHKEVDRDGE